MNRKVQDCQKIHASSANLLCRPSNIVEEIDVCFPEKQNTEEKKKLDFPCDIILQYKNYKNVENMDNTKTNKTKKANKQKGYAFILIYYLFIWVSSMLI